MRSGKIGRNDPCWCGSGKKFKKCHYLSDDPGKRLLVDLASSHRKAFSQRMCLARNSQLGRCTGDIVAAHTVPRSQLAQIADEGHVYQIGMEVPPREESFPVRAKLVGINGASTINGFCAFHDNELF